MYEPLNNCQRVELLNIENLIKFEESVRTEYRQLRLHCQIIVSKKVINHFIHVFQESLIIVCINNVFIVKEILYAPRHLR